MIAKPWPKPTPETQPFWDGCKSGELRLQRCKACQHVQFYPRKLCSGCFSQDVEWFTASGRGSVLSWSKVTLPSAPGFEEELPFTSVLVKLAEGPTMLSVLRDCEYEQIDFDMPLHVIFEQRTDDIFIPYFKPA
jgi:uncharacterized OB-fold protein